MQTAKQLYNKKKFKRVNFVILVVMYLFDLTKINCSIYLIVKSLYYILELCNIKNFICDLVSVTKKLWPNHAK